mgnify:CR=1 FL=1
MAVEFRQRSAGEFIKMLKRRKWLVILPTLAVALAVAYVVSKLPSIYESTTLLTLKPPTISEKVVQSLSDEDLSQRLQTINQEVLSRTSLEPMIAKYKLFQMEKDAGMPTELIIEKMRSNVRVEPERTDNEKVAAFRIYYRDRSPEAARNVTAELASKYVNAQVIASTQSAEVTREFIENELNKAKTNLDTIEKQRLEVMMQNVETLPESSQGLIAQLEGLRKREETLTKEKETLITERGRLNDSITANNRQMRLIEDYGEKETQDAARQASQIEDTPAYDELENLKKNTDKRVQIASQSSSRKAELQKKNLELENQRIQAQIAQIDQQLQLKDQEVAQNSVFIGSLESKINTIPNVKVALEAINNQYQSAKTTYDDLLKKRNDASLQVERESNAQGETIRVVDAANLPQSPVNASKRYMAILMGAAAGMALGLFLAGLFEIPRLFKIQNIEDAKHYTGLPVLASVPPLLTHQEIAWKRRAGWLRLAAGIVASLASIPLLIMALQATRVFEKIVS